VGGTALAVRRFNSHAFTTLLAALLFLLLVAVSASPAHAEGEPPIRTATQNAKAWLAGHQNEDGSFGQRVPWRDTDLAVEALGELGQIDAARLSSWLDTTPANVDHRARRVALSLRLGSSTALDTASLLASQQEDGGFPLSPAYSSDVLDTVLVLRAVKTDSA
jgi:hypothetical protein